MAKKFGKLLLLSAAIGSVVGAVYYFKKKEAEENDIEDDYDDFSDEKDSDSEGSRSYVSLNPDAAEKTPESDDGEDAAKDASKEASDGNIPTGQEMFKEYASADNFFEETSSAAESSQKENTFTPLTEQVSNTADKAGENVEEFFDEEDAPGVEPPINDN